MGNSVVMSWRDLLKRWAPMDLTHLRGQVAGLAGMDLRIVMSEDAAKEEGPSWMVVFRE